MTREYERALKKMWMSSQIYETARIHLKVNPIIPCYRPAHRMKRTRMYQIDLKIASTILWIYNSRSIC
ncbi:MAG: hypothetical protein GF364_03005 [Candidatus Lokiarchaeota archaeon]|nr:hypothetical protein [Candidatus Lokiarchaeota archaeon]